MQTAIGSHAGASQGFDWDTGTQALSNSVVCADEHFLFRFVRPRLDCLIVCRTLQNISRPETMIRPC